jgi:hypothetical protein
MSTIRPVRVGSDPDRDPPETLMEVSVQLEHRRGLPPAEMERVVREVTGRLDAALAQDRFADLPLASISAESFVAAAEASPLWPLRMGREAVFTCPADVVEALERMCGGTDLGTLGHDLLGRAFELHVGVHLTRAAGADRPDALPTGHPANELA